MVVIPSGAFWMGSPDGEGDADERPQTRVTLSAYCLDRTEVTVGAYQACVSSGSCPPIPTTVDWAGISDEQRTNGNSWCNGSRADRLTHPVNCVNWTMATTYCGWSGGRLPTEAEWEFAARGPEGRTFPWGESEPGPGLLNAAGGESTFANKLYQGSDGFPGTAPVGSFPAGASVYGALDLAGNVLEWTSSRYGAYPGGSVTNPGGPSSGEVRVIRGGAFNADARAWVRGAFRDRDSASVRRSNVGFRCARGVPR